MVTKDLITDTIGIIALFALSYVGLVVAAGLDAGAW